ncbi:pyridoxamine 5'-phosphate oxidase family protein [Tistrella bauzanensis]
MGIDGAHGAALAQLPCFILATADDRGQCDCSYRGCAPRDDGGSDPLVAVPGPTELVFPDYSGNAMFNSLGNLMVNDGISLLFPGPEDGFGPESTDGRGSLTTRARGPRYGRRHSVVLWYR